MARKRTLSQSKVVYVGPPDTGVYSTMPASSNKELYNITSLNLEVTNDSEPIQIFGQLGPATRVSLNEPSITASFDYYVSNFDNEYRVGFTVNGQSGAFSKIVNSSDDERNYFIMTTPEGVNATIEGNPASSPCVGLGNCSITNWSTTFEVGSFPTSTIGLNALYIVGYADSTAELLPSIDPNTGFRVTSGNFTLPVASGNAAYARDVILRPRDVSVNLNQTSGLFYNLGQSCVSQASISVDFGRNPQNCLGRKFSRSRDLTFPIDISLSFTLQAPDLVPGTLDSITCPTGTYNAVVTARRPVCNGTGNIALVYDLRGLTFVSQSETTQVGDAGTEVTLNYITSVDSPLSTGQGLFLSGIFNP